MNKEHCRYCLKPMGNSLNVELVNGVKIPAHKHCIENHSQQTPQLHSHWEKEKGKK